MNVVGKYFLRGTEPGDGDRVRLLLVKKEDDGSETSMTIEIPPGIHQLWMTQKAIKGEDVPTDVEVIGVGHFQQIAVRKWEAEREEEKA